MTRSMSISLNWYADDCKIGKAFCKMDNIQNTLLRASDGWLCKIHLSSYKILTIFVSIKLTDMKIVNDTFSCGVRTIVAQPEGVCSQAIELKLFGDVIAEVNFYGGCSGNLKGIASLCKGHKISEVQQRLQGITCGPKNTSCPDQFAQLLKAIQY